MISYDKNDLKKLMIGKTIQSVEEMDEVLFSGSNGEKPEKYVTRRIYIKFKDGSEITLRAESTKGYHHDGSGGADNFIRDDKIPIIRVSN